MAVADGNDLIGVGFAPEQAGLVGAVPNKLNGAAATAQTGAALIISRNTELNPAAVTTNSFVFPTTAKLFNPYFLVNSSATPGFVWVPSGHTLVSGGATTANGSVSVGASASLIMWQYKSKFWTSK
jgi:hypothetical protein